MEQPGPGCGTLRWDGGWMVSVVPQILLSDVEFLLFPLLGERDECGDPRISSDAVAQGGKTLLKDNMS